MTTTNSQLSGGSFSHNLSGNMLIGSNKNSSQVAYGATVDSIHALGQFLVNKFVPGGLPGFSQCLGELDP